jgi:hypothetical protein
VGGVPPNSKEGASPDPLPCEGRGKFGGVQNPSPPRKGAGGRLTPANPQPTRVGKTGGGPGGRSPHGGGLWGVSPHETKRGGESPTLTNPPRVGPKTLANPQPTGVGKTGVQGGASPLAGGLGDVPPRKPKIGRAAHINNPATSGTQNAGKPSAYGGGQNGGPGGRSPTAKNSCHLIAFLTEEVPQKASCVHRLPPPMVVGESKNYPRFLLKVPYLRDPLL